MKANLTCLLTATALIAAGTVMAETIQLNELSDWAPNRNLVKKDGMLIVKKQTLLISAKTFDIDPGKNYTIKLSAKGCMEKSKICFGFTILDKNGQTISPSHVLVVPGSETFLTSDAKKGDKKLKVKDASKWKRLGHIYICKDIQPDFADLPNRKFLAHGIEKLEKKDNEWEVTLSRVILEDTKSGNKLRCHLGGGYLNTGGEKELVDKWETLEGSIRGISKSGWRGDIWPVGTAKAKVIILPNRNIKNGETELKDISITIE